MLLPAVAIIFIFHYIPMYGIQLAFRDFDFTKGIYGGDWVGLKYFRQFFNSYLFWSLITNTFRISATSILVGFPAPIILALVINQIKRERLKKVFQTTVCPTSAPHHGGGTVGGFAFSQHRNAGRILQLFGLGSKNLLGESQYFVPVYVLSDIWQTPAGEPSFTSQLYPVWMLSCTMPVR